MKKSLIILVCIFFVSCISTQKFNCDDFIQVSSDDIFNDYEEYNGKCISFDAKIIMDYKIAMIYLSTDNDSIYFYDKERVVIISNFEKIKRDKWDGYLDKIVNIKGYFFVDENFLYYKRINLISIDPALQHPR